MFSLLSFLLAPVLSGVLLVLAFPMYEQRWLGWVGLVPLLIVISGRSPGYGFFLSFACGLTFFPGVFSWILEISGYTFLHHAILGLYLGRFWSFRVSIHFHLKTLQCEFSTLFRAIHLGFAGIHPIQPVFSWASLGVTWTFAACLWAYHPDRFHNRCIWRQLSAGLGQRNPYRNNSGIFLSAEKRKTTSL